MKFVKYFMIFVKLALSLSLDSAKRFNAMNHSTQKSIRNLSIAIFILGGVALVYTYVQMFSQLFLDTFITPMVWNPEIRGWQIFILAGRFIGATLLYVLCCIFLYRTKRGLGNGEIFPKSNIALIRWTALVAAFLAFVRGNYAAAVRGESVLTADYDVFLLPLVILLFAGLYKMAHLAAEDSQLAI